MHAENIASRITSLNIGLSARLTDNADASLRACGQKSVCFVETDQYQYVAKTTAGSTGMERQIVISIYVGNRNLSDQISHFSEAKAVIELLDQIELGIQAPFSSSGVAFEVFDRVRIGIVGGMTVHKMVAMGAPS